MINIKNLFLGFEDIYQKILLAKFHKILTLLGGVDPILGAESRQTLTLNQLSPVTLDSYETFQEGTAGDYLKFNPLEFVKKEYDWFAIK